MFVAILGRQPEISIAELEAVYRKSSIKQISPAAATIDSQKFDIDILGGTTKFGEIINQLPPQKSDKSSLLAASKFIVNHYYKKFKTSHSKITFGISVYGLSANPRDIQKTGLILKSRLKTSGVSLRLIPNQSPSLSTATSHNNKLGRSSTKLEILIIKTTSGRIVIAESRGTQNIAAYTKRDRQRPRRDAFVGMLPPKLAQIIINLSGAQHGDCLWDPFCGTGTILQEARLRKMHVYGSDLSQKMVEYSTENMRWLDNNFTTDGGQNDKNWNIFQADATSVKLSSEQKKSITHIACETYLGQPFSAPPEPEKLREVTNNCNHIIGQFLKNIHQQISSQTQLCIAVPAWRDKNDNFSHLPLIKNLKTLGYQQLNDQKLIYYRPDQVVARELLVLKQSPIHPEDPRNRLTTRP